MGLYKIWLENRLGQEETKKLKEVWRQALQSLGIDGLKDTDALATSLTNIEYNKRSRQPPVKGGIAALKLLHNANIFKILGSINPDMRGNAEQAEKWLNKISNDGKAGGATVGDFLQQLFGNQFNELSGDDTPDLGDEAKAEVPVMPPKPDSNVEPGMEDPNVAKAEAPAEMPPPEMNTPQQATGQPPISAQTPQPMPQPPMGAKQGLF